MSSRVLRKLQEGAEKDMVIDENAVSDPELDLSVSSGTRHKQLNINRFDLLNEQSHSESEVKEDDNDTEAPTAIGGNQDVKRKKKKKKKKQGKVKCPRPSSEDNYEVDEIERSVREIKRIYGDQENAGSPHAHHGKNATKKLQVKSILSIQQRHLNANNELKRIFGASVVQAEQNKRRQRSRLTKSYWLAQPKETWPPMGKNGLYMDLVKDSESSSSSDSLNFKFSHSASYRQVQELFFAAVDGGDPEKIVAIINEHPYHVDSLIQISDLCRLTEDNASLASDVIERALFALESAFHPLFHFWQMNCRLDYRYQENRSIFIALFKHLTFLGNRVCYRSALEFCKMLLSLDPEVDPLGITLALDYYALRAKEYAWLLEFFNEYEKCRQLSMMPNFKYSIALARFYLDSDREQADKLLQDALVVFPGVLVQMLEACSVQPDARVSAEPIFNDKSDTQGLQVLMGLYVKRTFHIWRDPEIMAWLERNVNVVIDGVRSGVLTSVIDCFKTWRATAFQGNSLTCVPRNVARHILLLDYKELTAMVSASISEAIVSYDPLPPPNAINCYQPKTLSPTTRSANMNLFTLFIQSLRPNFNVNDVLVEVDANEPQEAVAVESPTAALRQRLAVLTVALHNMLTDVTRLNNVLTTIRGSISRDAPDDNESYSDNSASDNYNEEDWLS